MGRNMRLLYVALVSMAILIGCTKKTKEIPPAKTPVQRVGQVEHIIEDAPDDKRYKRLAGLSFIPAAPLDNKKPIYPPSLLSKRLPPLQVSVTIIVDDQGVVTNITPAKNDGVPQEFVDAAVEAISTWGFAPLERFDGDKYEPLPYTETYTFLFRQVDGKPTVK